MKDWIYFWDVLILLVVKRTNLELILKPVSLRTWPLYNGEMGRGAL
ncbi:hypothetical protein NITLEN_60002 [Nitrospira lenta]|uniref:Uncharacterized protein n=1 Tax=Nitrospira lenta TaxID=1436998 RepID=A0A330L906_9BACT|nr:hypothetical protein NITLEN_60002 [Nitrospira lenta]